MKILSLDLSTKTGFAVFDGEALVSYGSNLTLFKGYKPIPYLLKLVEDYIFIEKAEIIAAYCKDLVCKFHPDIIVIEQTNGSRSRTTQKFLEFIHFAVLAMIDKLMMAPKVVYMDTSKWRSICGQNMTKDQLTHNRHVREGKIRGKITKKHLAVAWCNKKYGLALKMKDNDAADAISIGYAVTRQEEAPKAEPIDVDKVFGSK